MDCTTRTYAHFGSFGARLEGLSLSLILGSRRHSLIVFPEGTRGSGTEVAPFKTGMR